MNSKTIVLASLWIVGCSEVHTPCGAGDVFGYAGADYCVYRAGLFEECPSSVPNQYDFGEFKACGEVEAAPAGLKEEVHNKYRDAGTDATGLDATGPSGDGRVPPQQDAQLPSGDSCEYEELRYESGAELCDIDGCNSCKCNPEPNVKGVGCGAAGCLPGYASAHPKYNSAELVVGGGKSSCSRKEWHLSSQDEAVSLALFFDGTFRWVASNCAETRRGAGRWHRDKTDVYLELVPEVGSPSFKWPNGSIYRSLVVKRDPGDLDGLLVVQLGESNEETWKVGGICPRCEDESLKSIEPCGNPFARPSAGDFEL